MKPKYVMSFLSVSIRPRATVCRGAHLSLNPLSEERDPAVDSVSPRQSAFVAETGVSDEDMLGAALVSQGTTGVSLTYQWFSLVIDKFVESCTGVCPGLSVSYRQS